MTSEHTFVIMAYKESHYLEDCIKSLRKQTIKSDILISTSTPSNSLKKISLKYQIPLLINDLHLGIGSDWSFAYRLAKTRYVTLAHHDDIYLPAYAESCLEIAKKFKNNSLIIFTDYREFIGTRIINRGISLIVKKIIFSIFFLKKNIKSIFIKKLFLSLGSSIPCPSVMYDKENIGDFEFSDDFLVSLDWVAWIKLSKRDGRFVYLNKKLVNHRLHDESAASIQTRNKRRKKEDYDIFVKLWPKWIAIIFSHLHFINSRLNERRIS